MITSEMVGREFLVNDQAASHIQLFCQDGMEFTSLFLREFSVERCDDLTEGC